MSDPRQTIKQLDPKAYQIMGAVDKYNALSEPEKQAARVRGALLDGTPTPTNADMGYLNATPNRLLNDPNLGLKGQYASWSDQVYDEQARQAVANNNPGQSYYHWGTDQLSNKTFSSYAVNDPSIRHITPDGTQRSAFAASTGVATPDALGDYFAAMDLLQGQYGHGDNYQSFSLGPSEGWTRGNQAALMSSSTPTGGWGDPTFRPSVVGDIPTAPGGSSVPYGPTLPPTTTGDYWKDRGVTFTGNPYSSGYGQRGMEFNNLPTRADLQQAHDVAADRSGAYGPGEIGNYGRVPELGENNMPTRNYLPYNYDPVSNSAYGGQGNNSVYLGGTAGRAQAARDAADPLSTHSQGSLYAYQPTAYDPFVSHVSGVNGGTLVHGLAQPSPYTGFSRWATDPYTAGQIQQMIGANGITLGFEPMR